MDEYMKSLIKQANRELRIDGCIFADTFMLLNNRGVDASQIETTFNARQENN